MPQVTVDPIGSVKVKVNSQSSQRVQSIQYLATGSAFAIKNAYDLEFGNMTSPIITYNATTEKFIVQTLKAIDGGTF
jgi:hypothetical protein